MNIALPAIQASFRASATQTVGRRVLHLVPGRPPAYRRLFGRSVWAAEDLWDRGDPLYGRFDLVRGGPQCEPAHPCARGSGVGGALLVPTSLALVSVSYPREQVGRAIGIWSGFTSITAAVGPLLGGALAQHGSWRWVFLINVPVALVVLAVLVWWIRVRRNRLGR